jgi:hypothetical protein
MKTMETDSSIQPHLQPHNISPSVWRADADTQVREHPEPHGRRSETKFTDEEISAVSFPFLHWPFRQRRSREEAFVQYFMSKDWNSQITKSRFPARLRHPRCSVFCFRILPMRRTGIVGEVWIFWRSVYSHSR